MGRKRRRKEDGVELGLESNKPTLTSWGNTNYTFVWNICVFDNVIKTMYWCDLGVCLT